MEKSDTNTYSPTSHKRLGGSPGAGKGTNTNFIMKERHLTAKPIVMSDLLDSAEARAVKVWRGQARVVHVCVRVRVCV